MSKILISAAAIAIAFASFTSAALAKEAANQTTKRLNQQQAMNAPDGSVMAHPMARPAANEAYGTKPEVQTQTLAENAPTEVYVAGAARTSTDAVRGPDTNPQSTGTAMVDTPYVTVVPTQK
ncbi:hypothetical protein AEAC466_11375 [Asticcacaulis sp. AC466]|uniref:hypothetical protein n=1 Tax=Asticcacaulis sp. AC466 TaxID=1282362 RepID=UPI0003C3AF99|nr:hypothetical protein [Asticcacaulis sp. AC466]ESQ83922.1 hypothetical protein AEAC466_11375 [Asticcacaulis sp. AC466]